MDTGNEPEIPEPLDFSSGLGGRGIMKKLQTALDEQIFEDPCRDMYSGVDQ